MWKFHNASSQCSYLLLGPLETLNSAVIFQGWSELSGVWYLQLSWYRVGDSIKPNSGFAVIWGFSAFNGSLLAGRLACNPGLPRWPVCGCSICLVLITVLLIYFFMFNFFKEIYYHVTFFTREFLHLILFKYI